MEAIIGTYYKTEKAALEGLRRKERLYRKSSYAIFKSPKTKGVLLIIGKQAENLLGKKRLNVR